MPIPISVHICSSRLPVLLLQHHLSWLSSNYLIQVRLLEQTALESKVIQSFQKFQQQHRTVKWTIPQQLRIQIYIYSEQLELDCWQVRWWNTKSLHIFQLQFYANFYCTKFCDNGPTCSYSKSTKCFYNFPRISASKQILQQPLTPEPINYVKNCCCITLICKM